MKVGDRVKILMSDYTTEEIGSLGTIKASYWSSIKGTMFGLEVDGKAQSVGVFGDDSDGYWAYGSWELEVIE